VQSSRRRGRGQQRILYWFRTPPGVRVGRAAIDEEAIHLLEQHNPDVQFDWTRILKSPQGAEPSPRTPPRPTQPPRTRDDRPPRPPASPPPAPAVKPLAAVPAEVDEADAEAQAGSAAGLDAGDAPPEAISAALTHLSGDPASSDEADLDVDVRQPAAFARLGAEGLARLRARYAEVLARISDRPIDDAVREELKARAERLNPDAWVTDDEVAQGLEQYEAVFESLRSVVGHPRRRRRRQRGDRGRAGDGATEKGG
jgi:hypothetical protein